MDGDEEFFDAVTGFDSDSSSGELSEAGQGVPGLADVDTSKSNSIGQAEERPPQENGVQKHRTCLPAPTFTRSDFSLWGILKKCVGLELSKITMPVAFNEPLSFLQRLTEYMEHTALVHRAARQPRALERMQCVAAFAVSAVASQWERTGKPFNPLLGETYELIREDLGFRFISEQVSHHPPVSAFHAEGLHQDFLFHGSIYPKLKFWGKSVEAEPRGTITLELLRHEEAYTWTNPTCCVHNVIIGKLWIEQYGTVQILNHRTGDRCVLHFKPCGLFGKELHRVEGYIQDKNKKKLFVIYGKWTECLWGVEPAAYESFRRQGRRSEPLGATQLDSSAEHANGDASDAGDAVPEAPETVQVVPGSKLLWRVSSRPPNSAQMYNFTSFTVTLNELQPGMERTLAPTDCRLRPDIRSMENGDMDLASQEKDRLEEKQREARRERDKGDTEWQTRWFHPGRNPHTGAPDWLYTGGYFERNFSGCPDIY
ncbi:oxysterol-binding protein-related protein 2 [Sturnira hondurensis]|uniref:oxysterol-binding protein-related protein 2 n=1 Tax=Sturnira hondurensis TaxID=192404 RepID=UPI00187A9C7F|nr:oxysterol-binding protein-related protein 2 [Sturnira hondurensis]